MLIFFLPAIETFWIPGACGIRGMWNSCRKIRAISQNEILRMSIFFKGKAIFFKLS